MPVLQTVLCIPSVFEVFFFLSPALYLCPYRLPFPLLERNDQGYKVSSWYLLRVSFCSSAMTNERLACLLRGSAR